MDVDWLTVTISTALSAVVGTVVSLAAVAQTTTRQRRAERRDAARQQIKELVTRPLAQVTTYRAGLNKGIQKGEEDHNRMRGDDYTLASRVLTLADELGPMRRWLVMRRCRRLFGPFIAETCLSISNTKRFAGEHPCSAHGGNSGRLQTWSDGPTVSIRNAPLRALREFRFARGPLPRA
jgi:hypothetical protein